MRLNDPRATWPDKFSIPMTADKMSCLLPNQWLNDEVARYFIPLVVPRALINCNHYYNQVINFYMEMMNEQYGGSVCAANLRGKLYFFNSFLWERLMVTDRKFNFSAVSKWTKNIVDLFDHEMLFFPVNIRNTHWILVAIQLVGKTIRYVYEHHID